MAEHTVEAMAASVASRFPSVMIVDDSVVQRQHSRRMCQLLGIPTLYEAEHGLDALAQLQCMPQLPSLLLLDLHMPHMDGVEFLTQLHAKGWAIPVVVASTVQDDISNAVEDLGRTLGLAMQGVLRKPYTAQQLRSVLQASPLAPLVLPAAEPSQRMLLALTVPEMEQALAQQHIVPYYQPKVDLRSGEVLGVEVLARWHHPRLGFVSPEQFVAFAEAHGLIQQLTLHIMDQAMAQHARWRAQGCAVASMAINLSPKLLADSVLVQQLQQLSAHHGVSPSAIVLEITESAGVEHLAAAMAVLTRLRLMGFGLSIDDYGTGFSSMQQLARLPFTELKIDRSFVHGAHTRRNLRVILQSALEMAQRLQMVTVAEGVETQEDWQLLRRYGCKVAQGYFVARPMPAADVPAWVQGYRPHTLA